MRIGSVSPGATPDISVSKPAEGTAAQETQVKAQQKVKASPDKMEEALKSSKEMNEELLDKSIEQANKSLKDHNRVIERAVHDVTHTIMYTIKDTKTDQVIAEYPPKKIQDMIAKMWELAGLFVDEKA